MQPNDTTQTVSDRSTEFVAVSDAPERTNAQALVVAAYLAFWFVVFLLVWRTWSGQRKLQAQLDRLESQLTARLPGGPQS